MEFSMSLLLPSPEPYKCGGPSGVPSERASKGAL
eukprot:CAMPEP_0119140912 /NCGR_PEP_ID=MMETSP1310-20130426/30024_1 /TAXON_ID=464262 /ORGANISM="Genus nov. species nov., Strain RCC2339" /LENGTH=33 /DNA_ID= /DNA_START= /DNA_END= /DNA_ORIENTATION=